MKLNPKNSLISAIAFIVITCVAAVIFSPSLNWRMRAIGLKLLGNFPELLMSDLAIMLLPGSPFALDRLPETKNPFAVIKNPLKSAADVELGRGDFRKNCSTCHGDKGQGGVVAPSLQSVYLKHGRSDWAIFSTIRNGVPKTAMPAHNLSRDELWRLVAYVQSLAELDRSEPILVNTGYSRKIQSVSYQNITDSETGSRNWMTYSGSYSGARHSLLEQISPKNVNSIVPKWIFQFESGQESRIECTPLVHEGRMYLTSANGDVLALDAATGEKIWSFSRRPSSGGLGWAGGVNRGVALLGEHVFVGTADGKLIALSIATGKVVWEVEAAEPFSKRSISAAPLAINELVLIGTAGSFGRGSIAAFDARTGKEKWRFFTIPLASELHGDSWAGKSGLTGGAAAWMTGSYDPSRDIVYWGTGNPAPDYNKLLRLGDNLYSNSVLALQGASGKLLWHFQFTPGDDHDWDSAQVPVLASLDRTRHGGEQLLTPNRNGFFYSLDRSTGKFNFAQAYVFQNWAKLIDKNGRPVLVEHGREAARGVLSFPGSGGGTNWYPPSFDGGRGLFFIPAQERSQIFFPGTPEQNPGPKNFPADSGKPHYTLIKAVDARTGSEVWKHQFPMRMDKEGTSGLLSTASGLVFGANLSTFLALRSDNGEKLWEFSTGGQISAAPMTYSVAGKQFVAIAAGNTLMAFGLAQTAGH